jgi:hypothetical protein
MALPLPPEPRDPGFAPFRPTQPKPAQLPQPSRMPNEPDRNYFSDEECIALPAAVKVVTEATWFAVLDGELVAGPLLADGTIDYREAMWVDIPDRFDHPELIRKAERMLRAGDEQPCEQRTLRELLPRWPDLDTEILDMRADTVCGADVLKVVTAADALLSMCGDVGPAARDQITTAALHQARVLYFG